MSQVSYGTITITDTNDIERIYPVFRKGGADDAPALEPLSYWKENISQIAETGDYIWQRIVTKKSGITITSDNASQFYSDAMRLTGDQGLDAPYIKIAADSLVIQIDSTGNVTSENVINIIGTELNTTIAKWFYSIDDSDFQESIIKDKVLTYAIGTQVSTERPDEDAFTSNYELMASDVGKYLWTRYDVNYNKNAEHAFYYEKSLIRAITKDEIIQDIIITADEISALQYCINNSPTEYPTSGWSDTRPSIIHSGEFLWVKRVDKFIIDENDNFIEINNYYIDWNVVEGITRGTGADSNHIIIDPVKASFKKISLKATDITETISDVITITQARDGITIDSQQYLYLLTDDEVVYGDNENVADGNDNLVNIQHQIVGNFQSITSGEGNPNDLGLYEKESEEPYRYFLTTDEFFDNNKNYYQLNQEVSVEPLNISFENNIFTYRYSLENLYNVPFEQLNINLDNLSEDQYWNSVEILANIRQEEQSNENNINEIDTVERLLIIPFNDLQARAVSINFNNNIVIIQNGNNERITYNLTEPINYGKIKSYIDIKISLDGTVVNSEDIENKITIFLQYWQTQIATWFNKKDSINTLPNKYNHYLFQKILYIYSNGYINIFGPNILSAYEDNNYEEQIADLQNNNIGTDTEGNYYIAIGKENTNNTNLIPVIDFNDIGGTTSFSWVGNKNGIGFLYQGIPALLLTPENITLYGFKKDKDRNDKFFNIPGIKITNENIIFYDMSQRNQECIEYEGSTGNPSELELYELNSSTQQYISTNDTSFISGKKYYIKAPDVEQLVLGEHGAIRSGNYVTDGSETIAGMMIDLDDGLISTPDFYLQSTPINYQLYEGINSGNPQELRLYELNNDNEYVLTADTEFIQNKNYYQVDTNPIVLSIGDNFKVTKTGQLIASNLFIGANQTLANALADIDTNIETNTNDFITRLSNVSNYIDSQINIVKDNIIDSNEILQDIISEDIETTKNLLIQDYSSQINIATTKIDEITNNLEEEIKRASTEESSLQTISNTIIDNVETHSHSISNLQTNLQVNTNSLQEQINTEINRATEQEKQLAKVDEDINDRVTELNNTTVDLNEKVAFIQSGEETDIDSTPHAFIKLISTNINNTNNPNLPIIESALKLRDDYIAFIIKDELANTFIEPEAVRTPQIKADYLLVGENIDNNGNRNYDYVIEGRSQMHGNTEIRHFSILVN